MTNVLREDFRGAKCLRGMGFWDGFEEGYRDDVFVANVTSESASCHFSPPPFVGYVLFNIKINKLN